MRTSTSIATPTRRSGASPKSGHQCHAPGPGHPGTTAIAALYGGAKPAALEERTDLTPDTARQFVRKGVSVMPFFRKTEISDADLDALAAYLARKR